MRREGRLGDALLLALILAALILTMTAFASAAAFAIASGPRRAMEPESWANAFCESRLGHAATATAEFDACTRDALTMPLWHPDGRMLSAAAACLVVAMLVAGVRGTAGRPTGGGGGP